MTSTDSVELTSTINTGLPWKMVAKGSRSSTRRNKKPLARSPLEVGAVDKTAAGAEVEGVSDSEKLGVALLGDHFAEKVEQVPIKKRRFNLHSPSTSSRPSSRRECSKHRAQTNHVLHVSRFNPNLIDGKPSENFSENPDCSTLDFSGIEILADVACRSDITSDISIEQDRVLVEEPPQQQNQSTSSVCVEGDPSSAGTAAVFQKDTVHESTDQAVQGKSEIVVPRSNPVDILHDGSNSEGNKDQDREASGGMVLSWVSLPSTSSAEKPKGDFEAGECYDDIAHLNNTVGVAQKSSADERAGKAKGIDGPKDDRLLWDLNLSVDAWGQPCYVEDDASRRDTHGEVTASVCTRESKPVENSKKDLADGVGSSEGNVNTTTSFGYKPEEFQSDHDSQFEDGELREPYPCWEENEGDAAEVELVDYGSEPEDERFNHVADGNGSRHGDVDKGVLVEMKSGRIQSESRDAPRMVEANEGSDVEKHVVVCLNDSDLKARSPRVFSSKPFKTIPSHHDTIPRRRFENYEDLSKRDRFVGRERAGMEMRGRSPGRMHFGGWDSKPRLSPPIYKGSSYHFGRPRPKSTVEGRGLINGFDQPGTAGPNGYVRRQFSSGPGPGPYRGRFRRFPDGGAMNRDFRSMDHRGFRGGDGNEYPGGRMHNYQHQQYRASAGGGSRGGERSNSPVFRRLNYSQLDRKSRSRSRSRSPVMWNNNRNRSPQGFRPDNSRMERVRLPFQKRFPTEQEMGYISPPRNRMSPQQMPARNPRFYEGKKCEGGENHNNRIRGRKSVERMYRGGGPPRFQSQNGGGGGGASMRRVSSENHFRTMVRHNRRFEGPATIEDEERSGSGRRSTTTTSRRMSDNNEDDGADTINIRRFRFNGEQNSMVTNNAKDS